MIERCVQTRSRCARVSSTVQVFSVKFQIIVGEPFSASLMQRLALFSQLLEEVPDPILASAPEGKRVN